MMLYLKLAVCIANQCSGVHMAAFSLNLDPNLNEVIASLLAENQVPTVCTPVGYIHG